MKTYKTVIALFASALFLVGCTEAPEPDYVEKEVAVADPSAFALGADISWVTQLESEGYTFVNSKGDERECIALMKEIGMNSIRLRVWVDPSAGWCNKGDVLVKALRAQNLGMNIMVDFHYSDSWADPAKQVVPAAWLNIAGDNTQLCKAVSDHTTDVLSVLKANGVDVAWVQVGNEVTHGMLCHKAVEPDDTGVERGVALDAGGGHLTSNPANFAALVNAGYDAVKAVYPEAQVIIHVDRGYEAGFARTVFNVLDSNDGKYDIIGLSVYPNGDGSRISSCVNNIKTLAEEFSCPVMICETGMAAEDPDTAYSQLSTLIKGAKDSGHCLGVFYWEPEAPVGYNNGYAYGAFLNNAPSHAMDAFTEAAAE